MRKPSYSGALKAVLQPWARLHRGLTLGVRIAVFDGESVMLVRHTYLPGWIFPGGGVERGETVHDAAIRELREETAIVPSESLKLHGIFSNEYQFPGDHVVCFRLNQFTRQSWKRSMEIADARFFPLTSLPSGTSGGTKRRIAELQGSIAVTPGW